MIHLFRHGQVEGPAALYGRTDVELSEDGKKALLSATCALPTPQLIVTSPLQRCYAVAASQAQHYGCEFRSASGFREMDFGQWDGVPYCMDSPAWPAMKQFWQNPSIVIPPDGESLSRMQKRVSLAWHELIQDHQQTTWVFAHGGVIRLILAELLGLDWRNPLLYSVLHIDYASRSDITYQIVEGQVMTRVHAIGVPASV